MFQRALRFGVALTSLLYLAGCATYGEGMNKTLQQVEKGSYQKANKSLESTLNPKGDDGLLYHLEFGTIHHLAGNYKKSNRHLEKAHSLADELRSKQASDYLAAAMVNPRETTYMGSDVERVYINYYKSLNYLMMAQLAEEEQVRDKHMESARVEIRRLDNTLSSMSFEKGNYKEVKDKEKETFAKLMDLFKKFQGNWLDEDWLVYREDAYARYMAGVLYEKSGDFDDARIAYQKAAELYGEGYTKQYDLDSGMAERAWFDTIRMMRRGGGWEGEWQRFAEDHLSQQWRDRLDSYGDSGAQLMVVQHMGMIPQRKEMNLHLTANAETQSLELRPVLGGTEQQKEDQMSWFFLLYGDKGVMSMLDGFQENGLAGVHDSVTSKTVSLGPAWTIAENLRIPQAIGNEGIRVTVPYYSPLRTAANGSRLKVNGERVTEFKQAESLYQLVLQEQLLNAGSDLNGAMARATFKNTVAAEAGGALGGGMGRLLAKLVASGSSAAETRNWLTLPYGIRVARVSVEPGEHTVDITSLTNNGNQLAHKQRTVEVDKGEIKVVVERTMDPSQQRPHREGQEMKTASQESAPAQAMTE